MPRRPFLFALTVWLLVACVTRGGGKVDFNRDVLPVLSENCFHCHGPDAKNRKAKLRLDDEKSAKQQRDGGAAIVPGKSADSEAYRRLTAADPGEVMPPPRSNRKLTAVQIALVKRWIDEGAAWAEPWALSRLVRPAVPRPARCGDRVRNPIDAFVFARLEKEGLAPAPTASREAFIRRVSLDLTGLPPSPGEVDAFLADDSPGAYERVVDRLLASPQFGERMAWDWLDAARYADSNGYQGDGDRTMWPWRDWVVQAFNRNLPYDQFTVWQLAGDLLPSATIEQKLATGFCRNHMINGEGGRIPEENRVEYVMDMAETTATVWLGLTLNCCRCHDHKFDPLAQRDYYRLFAFFNQTPVNGGGDNPQTPPVLEFPTEEHLARLKQLQESVRQRGAEVDKFEHTFFPRPDGRSADQSEKAAKLPDPIKAILKVAPAQRGSGQLSQLEKQWEKDAPEYLKLLRALRTEVDARNGADRSIPRVMVMEDMPKARETYMLDKGLYDKHGAVVTADVPAKLPALPPEAPRNRLGLARWLVAPENPLTARVTANRFWQQFFGVGLVKTPEDFGVQGEKPSHPDLLDWLAAEFAAPSPQPSPPGGGEGRVRGWDVKGLCRLIVTSETYRQSAKVTPELHERDPHNRLLARGPRLRLPSWMLRDQALAAGGLLVRRVGGPPVRPYQPAGVWEDATFGSKQYRQDKGDALYRRSLYTFWRRIVGPTEFFDTATRQTCWVKQVRTNTPLHALVTLNDPTYVEAARAMAERVLLSGPEPRQRVEFAFRLVLARRPSAEESQVLLGAVDRARREFAGNPAAAQKFLQTGESARNQALDPVEHAAYAALCHAILNVDEALTKE